MTERVSNAAEVNRLLGKLRTLQIEQAKLLVELEAAAGGPAPPSATGHAALFDRTRLAPYHLTDRELDVVALLFEGMRMVDVAKALALSKRTAEAHRLRAGKKLGIRYQGELTALLWSIMGPREPGWGGQLDV